MAVAPFAVWRPVPSHSGAMTAHQGLVLHVQVGDNSPYGEFADPSNSASSTWWVSKSGVVEQYVDSDMAAWTQAGGNFTWNSVETEGLPSEPLTAAQVAGVAKIFGWGAATYGWPHALAETPAEHGLGWHGMGGVPWGNHPNCPGDIRKAQRPAILAASQSAQTSASPPPTGVHTVRQALPAAALPVKDVTAGWAPDVHQYDVVMLGADGHVYHSWYNVAGKSWNGPEVLDNAG